MTSIHAGIPVAGLKQVTFPMIDGAQSGAERSRMPLSGIDERLAGPSPAERAAQIAKQRAEPAHTVYMVGGKVIAMHQHNGFTTFGSSADGGASTQAKKAGAAQGLTGEALNTFVADAITASLKQKYGAALQVETYRDPATAPSSGAIEDAMFGRTPTGTPKASPTSLVAYDAGLFSFLHGAARQ